MATTRATVRRWFGFLCVFLLGFAATATRAQREPLRLALLIGNQGYSKQVGPLTNPHKDIEIVGAALKAIGFEVVATLKDAKRAPMLTAVRTFASRLRNAGPNTIGFVYYSGHGAAETDSNTNYLIPVDAPEPGAPEFWDEALKLDDVLRLLDGARNAAKFVVFDACRNELAASDKSTTKGFVAVAEQAGMFVAYATAQGRTASDRGTRGGPYANVLAAEIVKPGIHHLDLFQNIKEAVTTATDGRQVPWERNGLARREYLAGAAVVVPPPAKGAEPDAAERAWEKITGGGRTPSTAELDAIVRRFGNTFHGDLARIRLEEMNAAAVRPPVKGSDPGPPPLGPSKNPPVALAPTPPPAPSKGAASGQVAGTVFRDCPTCPEMVVVPAGNFMMGSPSNEQDRSSNEGPQRRVTIAQPFAVGKFEVTFAEWDACVAGNGCTHKPGDENWGRGKRPVINVSWDDAKQYVGWLAKSTGQPYRLLTEAEWEYAARAGTTTQFSFGSTISTEQANYDGNYTYGAGKKGVFRQKTVDVGSLNAPNAFGLHDMHGNVWEWVEDCYKDTYNGAPTDGTKASDVSGCSRVLRGGSWGGNPGFLRAANRVRYTTDIRYGIFGFRVARSVSR